MGAALWKSPISATMAPNTKAYERDLTKNQYDSLMGYVKRSGKSFRKWNDRVSGATRAISTKHV